MSKEIPIVVNELLRYRHVPEEETRGLRELAHNADLCPKVRSQLELLLESYVKYDAVAYDVQGIHDLGTDVLLKYYPQEREDEGAWEAIAIQVKSYDDLQRPEYLKDLRSQCLQAKDEYGDKLRQYVIMLCTDGVTHREKIREIGKAFSKTEKVVVILPTSAVTFLSLKRSHVNLVVDELAKSDDVVLQRAREYVEGMTPGRAAVTLGLAYHGLRSNEPIDKRDLIGDPFVKRIYERTPDLEMYYLYERMDALNRLEEAPDDEEAKRYLEELNGYSDERTIAERLQEDVDALVGDVVSMEGEQDILLVDPAAALAIKSLLLDLEVRYEVRGVSLLDHVFGLLGVMRRFGFELQEDLLE